jgi:hypothetical protein
VVGYGKIPKSFTVTDELKEIIHATGHENILSTNMTTFEITKDTHITKRGDCIIAVNADKAGAELSQEFKKTLQSNSARLTITIEADTEREIVNAFGHQQLTLTHPTDLVVRRSDYVCNRTLAIHADKVAKDFHTAIVKRLQDPKQTVLITLTVEMPTQFQHRLPPAK